MLISISACIAEYLHVLCVDLKLYSTYLVLYSLKHNLKSEWHLDPCQKKNLFLKTRTLCSCKAYLVKMIEQEQKIKSLKLANKLKIWILIDFDKINIRLNDNAWYIPFFYLKKIQAVAISLVTIIFYSSTVATSS